MTIDDAAKIIYEKYHYSSLNSDNKEDFTVYYLAYQAMSKQITKKLVGEYNIALKCPTCLKRLTASNYELMSTDFYCKYCGQKLASNDNEE